jgi:hypothetical protein
MPKLEEGGDIEQYPTTATNCEKEVLNPQLTCGTGRN